ncbi:hypothetical protein BT63DRAFT_423612 [Microthyrium microscopicum]|uniref:Stress-associated endoplasmic reticulum protein n=1 Tax=Microthyrium microscopicum TaxID=703497 RepID=A0A6A6UGM3_9PEZI|nr:hypothetical protein BT63DRAFT_423612 [Microthyrium microscopicum]
MAQTPQQRRANAKFAKSEEDKRGKPISQQKKKREELKSPISLFWVAILALVIIGGIFIEVIRMWF